MRQFISTFLLLLFTFLTPFAQTSQMNKTQLGHTFSANSQQRSVMPLLREAERQFRLFNYEGTFLTLETALVQKPYSSETFALRAKFKKMIGMDTEARLDIQHSKRINPVAANLYGYYGQRGLLNVLVLSPEKAIENLSTYQKLNYYYEILDEGTLDLKESDQQWAIRKVQLKTIIPSLNIKEIPILKHF